MEILKLIGRKEALFLEDLSVFNYELCQIVSSSSFLVLGGAGTIGQAVTKEIFKRHPRKLHVVDISENNLVELLRDIRSSFGYIEGDFRTFVLDICSVEYESFIADDGRYDYVLNLSALKHVRSEKDRYTLMRMIKINILNTDTTVGQAIENCAKKYFSVSTDKAANPVNMMGASKYIMEMFLMRRSRDIDISTARFANVAFSDGSLLDSFSKRVQKIQPIVAPNDIKRYFVSPEEAGELCLMSCIFGENRDIFFPKLDEDQHLISFSGIAERYLNGLGYEPYICSSEEEARELVKTLPKEKKWPCLFAISDTTGEKSYEEFFTSGEKVNLERFKGIGVIKSELTAEEEKMEYFLNAINHYREVKSWTKRDLLDLFGMMIPDFKHMETGKFLDEKM